MIKWLSEITVTSEESTNYYHYHDNKMLPPNVDEERAAKEGAGVHSYGCVYIIQTFQVVLVVYYGKVCKYPRSSLQYPSYFIADSRSIVVSF